MFKPEQIAQNVEGILHTKNVSNRKFLEEAGLKHTMIDTMKRGSMPSADKMVLLADALGVSLDYLLGIQKKNAPDDTVRSALIDKVIRMSDSQAKSFLALLESMEE